jgi:glycosyltransferase involved in cell wall biosynthesis
MSLASRSFLSYARVSATWNRALNPVTWVANLWSGSRQDKARSRSVRHWAINGDYVTLRPTGVARYAREVTLQLDALMAERHPLTRSLHLELIVPRESDTGLTHIPTRLVREFKYPRLPQFWVQAQLPLYVKGGLLSFCNLAPVTVSRQIACIHDLHTRLMPESYGLLFRWAHRIILPLLGRRAARITTVSGLSRQHLADYGVAPQEKVVVTYNGADHAKRWVASRSRLLDASTRPYVVCLGRDLKYKNTELMVRLAPFLDEIGFDLLIAGDVDLSAYCGDGARPADNIRLLGRIDDDEFAQVLSRALCFLFPSRIEGFGLPAIEAMVHGCPVIASTSPCLPEICGDAALFADPDSIDDWLGAIAKLRDDGGLRTQLVDNGNARAGAYSWRKIAELYLQLMAEVDGVDHLGRPSTHTLVSAEHG